MAAESLSSDLPEAPVERPTRPVEDEVAFGPGAETVLTVAFAVAAVLFVSFVAVATGIV